MNKKELSEQDICTKYITPAIVSAGWDLHHQIREQKTFTDGRIIVQGKTVKRGDKKRADYILYYKSNLPIAIIEAKDNNHEIGAGMQQALGYSDTLDIPFVFSSNGDGFVFHDKTINSGNVETEVSLQDFPSPNDLYSKYITFKGLSPEQEEKLSQEYYFTPNGKSPRYYQENAINRVVEAVLKGQNRILLTMATGTGKTYTAFQIMWRLWKSKTKKRILFLADRNILVDDPMRRDFAPFKDKMIKIKRGNFDIQKYTAYEVFVGIYQSATGSEEEQKIFKQFPKDFFDLIIVDECHRGSAKADSAWREILTHYSSATQIGMTATPKETTTISNIEYFGDPIYTYSLKQGIEDGFLAPYKVIRITLDKDVEGYRPEIGKTDKYGYEIEDREYNITDFDKNIVIDERTQVVAQKITEFLKVTDRYSKTIVFCVDIDHAERLRRALINENSDIYNENRKYIVRITGDNEEGKNELDNFIDPEKKFPVIVTTSKLLTTGVDAKTCRLIVLDANINSMVEFKQIIGRGTRIDADYQKYYFTIMDFRQATKLFADPDFDGDPVRIKEISDGETITSDTIGDTEESEIETIVPNDYDPKEEILIDRRPRVIRDGGFGGDIWDTDKPRKYYINGVDVNVINETVQFYDENGKLTTESITDYSKKNIIKKYRTMDAFLKEWKSSDRKTAIIEELEKQGVFFEELQKEIGKDMDPFDMILHVAYQKTPLTRKERALKVKKRNYFAKYGDNARHVLEALLDKYADQGITAIENLEVLKVPPLVEFGTPIEIVNFFGGKESYLNALQEMEQLIYVDSYADSYSN